MPSSTAATRRATLDGADWVEYDLVLGIASYAILDGDAAIVYDTHTSPDRGEFVRVELERRGVSDLKVVLSHWHLDHIAGAGAFAECEVIATERTAEHLAANRAAIEDGSMLGPPAINPVVMPTRTFTDSLALRVGSRDAELIHVNVHSNDAAVIVATRRADPPRGRHPRRHGHVRGRAALPRDPPRPSSTGSQH